MVSNACFSQVSSALPGMVGQGRVDAALGCARVAAARMDLGEDGHVDAGPLGFDGGAETGKTSAHYDHVMMDHVCLTLPN